MNYKTKNIQAFTLIEVLISMLILAVGLLGLMTLQLQALQTNSNSNLRTQATIAAYDMSERIRANNKGFKAGEYNSVRATGTTGTSISALDIIEWQKYLKDNLPEGTGTISAASTVSDGLDITVNWVENDRNNKSASSVKKSFVLRARFK